MASCRQEHGTKLSVGPEPSPDLCGRPPSGTHRWLNGPVFAPLRDQAYFERFFIEGGAVTWPNGADIAQRLSTSGRSRVRLPDPPMERTGCRPLIVTALDGVAGMCLLNGLVSSGVVILALMIGAGLSSCAAIDREDQFYLVDAEPQDPAYLFALEGDSEKPSDPGRFGFAVHRLQGGRGVVFGYRFYSKGSVLARDDETYRKVTVWLPSGLPRSPEEFDLADRTRVVAMFSRGSSAWPRSDCSGYVSPGTVRVEPRGEGYRISVDGRLEPRGTRGGGQSCRQQPVKLEWEAREVSFGDLTPWLGAAGPGAHPYSETHR